jgi:hypothetical protein
LVSQEEFIEWTISLICGVENVNEPYTDTKISETEWIREFNPALTESEEYVWHRDLNNRVVEVLEGDDWQFQFDNKLPFFINRNNIIEIPKMAYHRIIPGKTKLRIKINEEF